MKKIRVKFCNDDLHIIHSYSNFLLSILKKYYEVELSEKPDYVFYNETNYSYLNYPGIRIFYTGENITPNFNLCDYGIGYDYLTFGDRYFRMPMYLVEQFYRTEERAQADLDFTKQLNFTKQDLAQKKGFCSFVYSNYMADPEREQLFNKLSGYKRVDAGGIYLNNVGGRVPNKLAFEMEHKFSIACENSCSSGYTTEKLTNAFTAQTIPIYWGNPDIGREFNEKRFINCNAYKNFDEVLERVKQIDQDDELYLKIINEPVQAPGVNLQAIRENYELFLRHIIDQPLAVAKRRKISAARAAVLEQGEKWLGEHIKQKDRNKKRLAWLYQPFKKIPGMERLKQKFLAKNLRN